MKISCCCFGMVIGFLLAAALGGGVYFFFYCQKNPEAPQKASQKGYEVLEKSWDKVKESGDSLVEKANPDNIGKK